MFFEGSEKKVEIVVDQSVDLLSFNAEFFHKLVNSCNATILNTIQTEQMQAHLLSESSLFVWKNKIVMITCGTTILSNSVKNFIADLGGEKIRSVIFQRKNEYDARVQKTGALDDLQELYQLLPGKVLQFGHLDTHHMHLFNYNNQHNAKEDVPTSELLMYHISDEAKNILLSKNQTIETLRDFLRIEELFEGFLIDDYHFTPFGYSLNAIKKDRYATIHVTPQDGTSYISFETNVSDQNWTTKTERTLLKVLDPESFDHINFDIQPELATPNYRLTTYFQEKLDAGFGLSFKQYSKEAIVAQAPMALDLRRMQI